MQQAVLIIGVVSFFLVYFVMHFLSFLKKSKEFSRPRTREEKIALMLNKIEPRAIHDGYREIKNEEDCHYSSLILEYELAAIFGSRKADPNLNLDELKDPNKNSVLAYRLTMEKIEKEVQEELGEDIRELARKLKG